MHCFASCVQMCEAPLLFIPPTHMGTETSFFNAFWLWREEGGPGFWTQLWCGLIQEWSFFSLSVF